MTKEDFEKAMELVRVIDCVNQKKMEIFEKISHILHTPSKLTPTMSGLLKQQLFDAFEPIFGELAKKLEKEFEEI